MLRHAPQAVLHHNQHEEEEDGIEISFDEQDHNEHADHFIDYTEESHPFSEKHTEDLIRQAQLNNGKGIEDLLTKRGHLEIVLAEAVDYPVQEDQEEGDTESDDDEERVKGMDAMKSFAEQMTQHITDHIPEHMEQRIPITDHIEPLSSSDLQEVIEINSDDNINALNDVDESSDDESDESSNNTTEAPVGSIHPSQLVSHPSQLAPNSGTLQQLLQDFQEFARPIIPLPMSSPVPSHIAVPVYNSRGQLVSASAATPLSYFPGVVIAPNPNPTKKPAKRKQSASTCARTSAKRKASSPDSSNSKKKRWRPTLEQRDMLERCWSENQYPDQDQKQFIARQLGTDVTYKQVTSWFKHKRENDKAKGKFAYKYTPAAKFSAEQVAILEQVFSKEPYAKGKILQDLAQQLNVTDKRVQNWFKHKRSRLAQQGKFSYKPRNLLNSDQLSFLKGAFVSNTQPSTEVCEQLSSELNMRPDQVQRWFSTERSRKRRRAEQAKLGLMSADDSEDDDFDDDDEDEEEIVSSSNFVSIKAAKKKKSKSGKSKGSTTITATASLTSPPPSPLPNSQLHSIANIDTIPSSIVPLPHLNLTSMHDTEIL